MNDYPTPSAPEGDRDPQAPQNPQNPPYPQADSPEVSASSAGQISPTPPPPPPYGAPNQAAYNPQPGVPPIPPRYQSAGVAPAMPRRRSAFWRVLGVLLVLGFLFFAALLVLGYFAMNANRATPGLAIGGDRIGLLRVEGAISQDEEKQFWIKALRELGENNRVKGIVVRIDSPGGTVGASQELYGAIEDLRQRFRKPVYVSMGDLTASGGYYMASAADRIFALRGTLTGSIGVIFSKPQIGELTKKIGIQTETVKSGRFKDSGSLTRPMTEEERVMFDYLIQDTYRQFVSDILKYRKKPIEAALRRFPAEQWASYHFAKPADPNAESFLREIADGRVYTGEQALQLGLIDEIGTLDDVVMEMAKALGLEERPELLEPKRRQGGLREIFSSKVSDFLPSASQATLQYMMQLP